MSSNIDPFETDQISIAELNEPEAHTEETAHLVETETNSAAPDSLSGTADPSPSESSDFFSEEFFPDITGSSGSFSHTELDLLSDLPNQKAEPIIMLEQTEPDEAANQPSGAFLEKLKSLWKSERKSWILNGCLALLTLLALCFLLFFLIAVRPFENYDKIMPNVYCAGINLGGMTMEEAKAALDQIQEIPEYQVKVILPDRTDVFYPRENLQTLNSGDSARLAYAYGRDDTSTFGLYRAYKKALRSEQYVDIAVSLQYNTRDILNQAIDIYRETAVEPTLSEAAIDAHAHQVTITPGQPGRKIDPQIIYDAVCTAFQEMQFEPITLDYEKTEIDLNQLMDVCGSAAVNASTTPVDPVVAADPKDSTIHVTMGIQGWNITADALYEATRAAVTDETYQPVTVDMIPVEPAQANLDDAVASLSPEPVEPYYADGAVQEGSNGYSLDQRQAAQILQSLSYGQTADIPLTVIPPRMTAAEVEAVLFRDELSECSTEHTGEYNRTGNLSLACEAIDGTVLNAGEEFSFNDTVGERTADKGYSTAIVYVGNESVEELGGGICQVASTIYDAALYAEMEITHRENHQFFVTYVPGGLDATVYYGSVDFCFRNSTDYPVRINAYVSEGYVNISLDGTKTNDHRVELESQQLSSTDYSTVYEYSSAYETGYEKTTVTPYTGYSYQAYQHIYDGSGNLLETVDLGVSNYAKRDRVVLVGTGGSGDSEEDSEESQEEDTETSQEDEDDDT